MSDAGSRWLRLQCGLRGRAGWRTERDLGVLLRLTLFPRIRPLCRLTGRLFGAVVRIEMSTFQRFDIIPTFFWYF
jgi:hypothetical protein